jgi:hypothetical protein
MTCLGECRKDSTTVCHESGKCLECCTNECGCGFADIADESRYDNLCEKKWLSQQELPQ